MHTSMIVIFLAKELTASTAQCALKVFLYGKAKMVVRMQSLNPKIREEKTPLNSKYSGSGQSPSKTFCLAEPVVHKWGPPKIVDLIASQS